MTRREKFDKCPIWADILLLGQSEVQVTHQGLHCYSPRAGGEYKITEEVMAEVTRYDDIERVKITTWLVQQRRLGVTCPVLTLEAVEQAKAMSLPSMSTRIENLMRYLQEIAPLGKEIDIRSDHNKIQPLNILAHSSVGNFDELLILVQHCEETGLIATAFPNSAYPLWNIKLTAKGQMYLEALDAPNIDSRQAFVAMWFHDDTLDAYKKGIAPAIKGNGFNPFRIDHKEHNDKVCDEIIAEIRRSRFVVADFTCEKSKICRKFIVRGGVYFEAGFAFGLNIPVIWTCREDAVDSLHFDTRQYNHILWKDPDDLKQQLTHRIAAVITPSG
ncbi:MAG: hypothetical protein J4F41_01755 [Alphaproteobacteria bacterium]|nr:hypothetical protein [Alphaproteobacteria bacterium]